MDVDEIQSVQSRERQTDSLQQLRDSFYEEAGEFVRALRAEREQAAAQADEPFDAPQVNRLSDDIATAEQTLEAIYERRVGKIVKMASLAAADMPTEDGGLTTEEQELFDSLVEAIESNRGRVFDVLEGNTTEQFTADDTSDPTPTSDTERRDHPPKPEEPPTGGRDSPEENNVSPADLMGASDDEPAAPPESTSQVADSQEAAEYGTDGETASDEQPRGDGGAAEAVSTGQTGDESSNTDEQSIDRTTVKITSEVGEILGVDDRSYDLAPEDVVTLPDLNAKPLLEQGVAERLD